MRQARWAAAAVVAAGSAVLAYNLWPDDGSGGSSGSRTPAGTRAAPTSPQPASTPPRTIPAVREYTPESGPGWKPADGARVVVNDDALADEGRLVAGELGLTYAGEKGAKDVRDGDLRLETGGDQGANPESYRLTVRDGRAVISGPSEAGVFYGTRTLKQTVAQGGTAPEGVIQDEPAKAKRGLMLDIARKFYSADWIETRIREIADLKYNEFGLHFSDDQGFRVESAEHPEIVSDPHLTKAEVRRIVDLARSLHVRIVPEIDSPGHLGAVLRSHPDLQLYNANGRPTAGAIDISKPAAGQLVDELIEEYSEVFPGSEWHLGSDEYLALMVSDPEASYPGLAAAAREKYGPDGTVEDLTTGWLNDRAATVKRLDRTPRAWNDGFFDGGAVEPSEDIQVAYWTGKEIGAREPAEFLEAGRELINYNDEYLYYVLGEPQTFVYPTGQRIYEEWTPLVVRGSTPVPERYDAQILGGSLAVWGDRPDAQTQEQVAAGLRMPLRATTQKLWDPREPALSWTDFQQLAERLG
ncbi:beta-N-acetylhexosaminidase [Streptomyces abyssomicinicus]|uniref:beta-N-acetylhexosaminidase n=1 Tax=Streptomyces abyssomicinicus TaxID=574929 RepID=UPI0012506FC5|nr:glycoside hydrolase family 20 protein [Streptomyces abyssomicinicus]